MVADTGLRCPPGLERRRPEMSSHSSRFLRLLAVVLMAVIAFGWVGMASAQERESRRDVRVFTAVLLGSNEVGGGDPDGSGFAVVTLNQSRGTACFALAYRRIATPTRGHIHNGPAGSNGPIVVDFFNDNTRRGPLAGCLSGVSSDLIQDIRNNPDQYYFNVHNADFTGGAIRGQLR
jgi:hypothetical protein